MIDSINNPQIKHIRALLRSSKAREQHRQTVLEGTHLLQTALAHQRLPETVLIPQNRLQEKEIQELHQRLPEKSIILISETLANKISVLTHSKDIISLISQPTPSPIPQHTDCVLLDTIQDPGNVGTIFRSALASGIEHIILSKTCADAYSPKVLRAAMGAHFALHIHQNIDLIDFIEHYSGSLHATTLHHPQQKSLYQLKLTQPSAWIFGNEGTGIQPSILSRVKFGIHIPISKNSESLNVAMAASICLFEQARQRQTP